MCVGEGACDVPCICVMSVWLRERVSHAPRTVVICITQPSVRGFESTVLLRAPVRLLRAEAIESRECAIESTRLLRAEAIESQRVCGWALVWPQRLPGPKGPWCGDGCYPACVCVFGSERELEERMGVWLGFGVDPETTRPEGALVW
jgi:hypothetical protein